MDIYTQPHVIQRVCKQSSYKWCLKQKKKKILSITCSGLKKVTSMLTNRCKNGTGKLFQTIQYILLNHSNYHLMTTLKIEFFEFK